MPHATEPAVVARSLVKTYAAHRALDDFDLEVPRGVVWGLLGPNGAGKTTAVRTLATLLALEQGEARVAGADVRTQPDDVRRRIGLSGQTPAVDEILGGRQNLVLFARLGRLDRASAHRRADELLEQFELAEAADRPVKHYSGGMRRRLDLAVTLLLRPEVLFLDEPTTGLDPRNRGEVWAATSSQQRSPSWTGGGSSPRGRRSSSSDRSVATGSRSPSPTGPTSSGPGSSWPGGLRVRCR